MFRSTAVTLAFLGSLLFFAACGGGDEGLGECPPDSAAQQMEGSMVIMGSCLSCHSSSSTDRMGAPADANFDDSSVVKAEAEEIYAKINGTYETGVAMPPGAPLSDEEIEDVRVFLACQ